MRLKHQVYEAFTNRPSFGGSSSASSAVAPCTSVLSAERLLWTLGSGTTVFVWAPSLPTPTHGPPVAAKWPLFLWRRGRRPLRPVCDRLATPLRPLPGVFGCRVSRSDRLAVARGRPLAGSRAQRAAVVVLASAGWSVRAIAAAVYGDGERFKDRVARQLLRHKLGHELAATLSGSEVDDLLRHARESAS